MLPQTRLNPSTRHQQYQYKLRPPPGLTTACKEPSPWCCQSLVEGGVKAQQHC